ncbi:MAG: polyisoprenoid-binding protein YceI [Flavobacteriales bacterium]|jgi:polyisoprenoid-binding protein YceI
MKIVLSLLIVGLPLFLSAQTKDVKVREARVEFLFVKDKTAGTLTGVDVKMNSDVNDLSGGTISGSVKVATLSTKNKGRDAHLLSEDFFNSAKYPEMSFVCSSIYQEGSAFKAKGQLTIKGVSKEVIFDLYNMIDVLEFKTTIYSLDFGVSPKKERAKSEVQIVVYVPI